MIRTVGYLLLMGALAVLALSTGVAALLLDVPTLLYCLAGTVGGLLIHARDFAILRAFIRGTAAPEHADAVLRLGRGALFACYAVGLLGVLVLVIKFHASLDDPGNWYFFPPMESILCLGYTIVIAEFLIRPRLQLRLPM